MNDDLINSLLMCLIKRGIPIDDIRMEYQIILNKYNVLPAEKSVVVYSEGKNKMLARRFLIAKTVAGCSERTTQYYGKVLEFIFDKISKDVDTWEPDDIRYYMAVRARDGVSKTTINNERRVLSSLFGWLQREELITRNPMLKIEQIKTTKQKKEAFTQMEIEKIRAACRSKAETAMVETLLSTGCRVSELCSIRVNDIKDSAIVIRGKGDKERKVYLNAKAIFSIERYMAERSDTNPYLFPSTKQGCRPAVALGRTESIRWYAHPELVHASRGRDKSSIESNIRNIGKRAGVEKTHPHRFRRTCATFALRNGMPIEQVSKMLGHESIETTQIYLDLNEQDLEIAHRKYVT